MKRYILLLIASIVICTAVDAQQGVIGDILSGKLVKPKVGLWTWYDVSDTSNGQRYMLRQAVVGKEKIGRKTGYWVELELVPLVGYRSVYKMLLTGPSNDPKHVHRLIVREGLSSATEVPLQKDTSKAPKIPKPKRKSLGTEKIKTPAGEIEAEHVSVTNGDAVSDVWINNKIRPLGVVRMKSRDGELILSSYGEGGENARSVINDPPTSRQGDTTPQTKVEVRVGGKVQSDSSVPPIPQDGPHARQ